jgi:hypothetical protein
MLDFDDALPCRHLDVVERGRDVVDRSSRYSRGAENR